MEYFCLFDWFLKDCFCIGTNINAWLQKSNLLPTKKIELFIYRVHLTLYSHKGTFLLDIGIAINTFLYVCFMFESQCLTQTLKSSNTLSSVIDI